MTRRLVLAAPALLAPGVAAAQGVRSQRSSTDMAPTVLPHEVVQLERVDADAVRVGDIIVYLHVWDTDRRVHPYMKRVVALPGQRIAFRDGVPVLDGVAAASEYVRTEDLRYEAEGHVLDPELRRHREIFAERSYDTYFRRSPYRYNGRDFRNCDEVVVPQDQLFVVGDYRDSSMDSRWDGPIAFSAVQRRAVSIVSSPDPERVGLAL